MNSIRKKPQKNTAHLKSVAIVANQFKPRAQKESVRLRSWLKKRKIKVFPMAQLSRVDALITLGGDGTILSVAEQAAKAGVPVLGINLGRLGFLTAVDSRKMYPGLDAWIKGKWSQTERMMLEVVAPCSARPLHAINDVVIRVGSTTRVTQVNAYIDKEELGTFVGDGVIVGTPTGSTAYSLSAGGPVVYPGFDSFIITPICAHSFSQRPVVIPGEQVIELQLRDRREISEVQLVMDGQKVFLLKNGDRVIIRKSPYTLQLVYDPAVSYFRVLREKLFWGGN